MGRPSSHRILFVSNIVTMSGAEHILLEHLQHSDTTAHVLVPKGQFLSALQNAGIPATRSRSLGELRRDRHRLWALNGALRLLAASIEIRRIAAVWKPDLLVANNFAAGIYLAAAAKWTKRPWMWFIYDIFPRESIESKALRRLAGAADVIVAASDAVRRNLQEHRVPSQLIHVLYNGVDTNGRFKSERSSDPGWRRRLGIATDEPLVAFVGLIAPHKGPQLLLEVAPTLIERHNVHFVLAGEAPPQHEDFKRDLLRSVRDLGAESSVHFVGWQDPAEIFREADVVVVPSLFPDPLPTVVLEAMSMETIVIAADVGGVSEMITDGVTGYLFPEGEAGALRDRLLSILDKWPQGMGEAARSRVRQSFSLENKILQFNEIVDRLINQAHSPTQRRT